MPWHLFNPNPFTRYALSSGSVQGGLRIATFLFIAILTSFISNNANAAVANNGTLFYGDTAATTGTLRFRPLTNPDTFSAEINGPAGAASLAAFTAAKNSPTRDEVMIGQIKVNGTLDVSSCVGAVTLPRTPRPGSKKQA